MFINLFSFLVTFSQAPWLHLTFRPQFDLTSPSFLTHRHPSFNKLPSHCQPCPSLLFITRNPSCHRPFSLNLLLGSNISFCGLLYFTYYDWLFMILRYTLILMIICDAITILVLNFILKIYICLVFHNLDKLN